MASGVARREGIAGWGFVMPALVLLGVFMIYPILSSLWMSFQVGKGMNLQFGGFRNIARLAGDAVFLKALGNTLLFLVIQVPIMLVTGLVLAAILNDQTFRGRTVYRAMIFLPCVTSLAAYSVVFKAMFTADGVINHVLMALHLSDTGVPWMTDPFWARVLVIIAITWRWTGYNMVFYLAAMQNIDRSIYEAARIDGVPVWARFSRLTLPMMKPVILFTTVISTIGTLQLFDEPNLLTRGGPSDATLTLSMYIYKLSFQFMPSFGYAATVSYVIVLLVGLLTVVQFFFARDRLK